MFANKFWKTISVIRTSSHEVSSHAILPFSWTTPSLSMNSSLRSTRRIARKSSDITIKRLWLICFSKSCTLACSLTFFSKAAKYPGNLALPCNTLAPIRSSKSAMLARAALSCSSLMFISDTGSKSGMPEALKRLWFLMVPSVFNNVRLISSLLGSPSGMFERILLIRLTRPRAIGKMPPSALGPAGGRGRCCSAEPGSQGRKTSRTHCGSEASSPSASSPASCASRRRVAATRMPHPQSTSPSRMYTSLPGLRKGAMYSGRTTTCRSSSLWRARSFVK
mmetsp:Transcript_75971/g.232527  ORF Transcript_75971/g.232527 Transcript_75971/m.232527 type:complete len:279 (-) Transcript_75971:1860-2696(-)